MDDTYSLKTAMEEHLQVPEELLGWKVFGPLYDRSIQDQATFLAMQSNLDHQFGDKCYVVFQKTGDACRYLLIDPEHRQALDLMMNMIGYMENCGMLDDELYGELLHDAAMEEWKEMPFSQRLILILDTDEDLSLAGALENCPVDELWETLEERVHERAC